MSALTDWQAEVVAGITLDSYKTWSYRQKRAAEQTRERAAKVVEPLNDYYVVVTCLMPARAEIKVAAPSIEAAERYIIRRVKQRSETIPWQYSGAPSEEHEVEVLGSSFPEDNK